MNANKTCEPYRATIAALRDGRFDAVTPDQMFDAETHMNACAACRSILADVTPTPEPQMCDQATPPAPDEWSTVWRHIDASGPPRTAAKSRVLHFARPWGTLAAAAVVMLMVGLWHITPSTGSDAWTIQLAGAGDVEIESVESFDNSTLMIMTAGDNDEIEVIWVMDDEGV